MSGPCVMRPATAGDAEAAAEMLVRSRKEIYGVRRELLGDELMKLAFPEVFKRKRERITELVRGNPEGALIAEVDGRMAGLICWDVNPDKKLGELVEVTVDPDYQGKGIGSAMCRHVLRLFQARGCRAVLVKTGLDAGHAGARKLYEKLGFGPNTSWINYYQTLDELEEKFTGES